MKDQNHLLNDQQAIERIFDHIDNNTTDLGDEVWREPVENYFSQERFNQEIQLLEDCQFLFAPLQLFLKRVAILQGRRPEHRY